MSIYNFFMSSIGAKIVMAISGAFLILFIIIHLLGNLGIFAGQEIVNGYALFLHSMPAILWVFRILLILAALGHIISAIRLNSKNRTASGNKYKKNNVLKASIQSRTMMLGGITLLCFIVYHLAHFTFHLIDPGYENLIDIKGRHDAYNMIVAGFQNIYIALFYIIAQLFLGLHLSHGFFSITQTLGIARERIAICIKFGGTIISIIIIILYISIPLSVMLGIITYAH